MLADDQKRWLDTLPGTDTIEIVPYTPQAKEVFQQQQAEIQSILGADAVELHKGATAWGISGQGDVDIYVPVSISQFDSELDKLRGALGEPASVYPHTRVRWNRTVAGMKVEIQLVNQDAEFYRNNVAFWDYLETHPTALAEYERVKAEAAGTSTREYYTRKVLFIN